MSGTFTVVRTSWLVENSYFLNDGTYNTVSSLQLSYVTARHHFVENTEIYFHEHA